MTMVSEYSWESDTFTHHAENAARTAWRAAVAEIARQGQGHPSPTAPAASMPPSSSS